MAKTSPRHVSFQNATVPAKLSPYAAGLLLVLLALAIPVILVLLREGPAAPDPYVRIDVSGDPSRLSPHEPR